MKHNLKTVMEKLQQYLELPHEHPNKIFLATENELEELQKELCSDLIQDTRGLSEGNKFFIKGFQFALNEVLGVEPKVKEETKR